MLLGLDVDEAEADAVIVEVFGGVGGPAASAGGTWSGNDVNGVNGGNGGNGSGIKVPEIAGGAPVDAIDDKEVGSDDGGGNAHGSPLPPAAIPAFDQEPASSATVATPAAPATPACPNVVRGCWQLSTGHHDGMAEAEEVWDNLNRAVGQGFTAVDCGDIYSGVEELLGGYMMFGRWKDEGAAEAEGEAMAAASDAGADAVANAGMYDGCAEPNLRIHTKFVPDKRLLPVLCRSSNQGHVRAVVRRSLNRLGLASLPLVQFHWWDYEQVRVHYGLAVLMQAKFCTVNFVKLSHS